MPKRVTLYGMSRPASTYSERWENYWSQVTEQEIRVVWDAPADDGVALDWPHIETAVDPALPMVHLGCGHGRQTAFFGDHFERVVGVDISPSAIERARRENAHPNVEFRVANATDPDAMAALRDDLGDTNVYIRGVLHQLDDAAQGPYIDTALQLLGERGRLSILELRRGAERIFFPLVKMGLLSFLRPVLDNGIEPRGITPERCRELIPPTHEVFQSEPSRLMRLRLPVIRPFNVTAWHMAVRRRSDA